MIRTKSSNNILVKLSFKVLSDSVLRGLRTSENVATYGIKSGKVSCECMKLLSLK